MNPLVTASQDASAAPTWLHVTVMAVAVLILIYSLARHSN
ncbi:hypothetical protein GCM10010274_39620 [Streptomyces lavendofoliae]|uniref:Uncharacterized protein n=1 Tax=Streptomyces lavendofoliae TaxID=67314 RepID=A0A918HZF0_9ACTN|nr:hypothetical protein GCM10010274_39620 [Streptomyces lavendofoliae]